VAAQDRAPGFTGANEEVVVTAANGAREPSPARPGAEELTSLPAVIAVAPWAPDRPYLAALDAASPDRREAVFAEQQAKHGALPAFWLDVAEWHFRKGRRAEALAALLSALELPSRNSQTLQIVADRLVRYGEPDRAIFLLERLVDAERGRPQPKRTLALALARRAENARAPADQRRADLARAVSLLSEVVMTPWPNAYDGIEMISLMEVNRLIALGKSLGGVDAPLDPRLIALLDVDLRVVIEWNSEATDIDLWVDEPNGERAIYNNPRTVIGGRLSNDMTSGFGPEEYLLRNAPAGTFTIRAHVFAADRLNPNGASNVTARLIRDFGRPTQSEEVIDIELLPESEARERLIGRVVFRK
jgi:tetratricopeptide (TPR) repeat protein